jgi:hypothetical protein
MKRQRWIMFTAVALVLAVGACSDDETTGPEAVPGTLVVTLTTPNTDDGAIMFTMTGGEASNVTLVDPSFQIFTHEGTSSITVVIVGDIAAGALLEFDVPDVGELDSYSAEVDQVADRTNDLQALTGYSLSVSEVVE